MPDRMACAALVVRYSPNPSLGECLNVGIVLVSGEYVGVRTTSDCERIRHAFPCADVKHLMDVLGVVVQECEKRSPLHGEGALDVFRHVVPFDDGSIVCSDIMSGVTSDPARTLRELFEHFVGRNSVPPPMSIAAAVG